MEDNLEVDEIDGVRLVRIRPKPKKESVTIIQARDDVHVEEIDGVQLVRVEQKFLKDRRPIWSDMEIKELISIMKEKNIMPLLNGRQYRRADVFKIIADNLKKRGFKRTPEQVSIKWKHLRLCYFKSKSKFPDEEARKLEFPFYEEVDELFGGGKATKSYISIEEFNELINKKQLQTVEIDGTKFFESNNEPVRIPSREEIQQARESSITSALENFTRDWQAMVLRVAEREAEQDKAEKEKEMAEQREWEERLIEKQCAAMTRTNQEFLTGLKSIFEGLKK